MITDHSARASWILRSRDDKNFTAQGLRKKKFDKLSAISIALSLSNQGLCKKKLRPKGAKRPRAVIFLRCPRAVEFLAARDRKIHDAQAEWSITSLLLKNRNFNMPKQCFC